MSSISTRPQIDRRFTTLEISTNNEIPQLDSTSYTREQRSHSVSHTPPPPTSSSFLSRNSIFKSFRNKNNTKEVTSAIKLSPSETISSLKTELENLSDLHLEEIRSLEVKLSKVESERNEYKNKLETNEKKFLDKIEKLEEEMKTVQTKLAHQLNENLSEINCLENKIIRLERELVIKTENLNNAELNSPPNSSLTTRRKSSLKNYISI